MARSKASRNYRNKKKSSRLSFGNLTLKRLLVFVLLFAIVGSILWIRSFASPPNATEKMGVFRGAQDPASIKSFEDWIGRPVTYAIGFTGKNTGTGDSAWSKITDPGSLCSKWANSKYKLSLSTALLPNTNFTLAAGKNGSYNKYWTSFGQKMVANGCEDAIIRLGWEFNGKFYPWAAGGQEADFAAYWRQVVTTLRAVPGQEFKFDFTPLAGNNNADVEAAYPGDGYVDIIGLDAYDTSSVSVSDKEKRWNDQINRVWGLKWQKDFATSHNKQISYPEWGLTVRPKDNLGGGDNPYYIQKMYDWMNALPGSGGGSLAYQAYFEDDASDALHSLMNNQFPESTALYKKLFGVLPSSSPSDTTAPSTPTGLEAVVVGESQIDLSWQAATDNVGVVSYSVYRNNSLVRNVTGTSHSDTGLTSTTAYSYYVVAIDAAGNISSASNTVQATTAGTVVTPPPPPPETGVSVPFRLNSGATSTYTDPAGLKWGVDQYYAASGSNGTNSTTNSIAGTDKDTMYKSERWGVSSYNIPLAEGTYTLKLHFAEINPASGTRIFDVSAEGKALLSNYNISAEAGDFTAAVKEYTVTINDGVLNISFTKTSNATKLSGLEIVDYVTPPPPPAESFGTANFSGSLNKYGSGTHYVDVPKAGTISYTVTSSRSSGRFDVTVYDPRGVKVNDRPNTYQPIKDEVVVTEPGKYKFVITSRWWSKLDYKLEVKYPK